MVSDATTDFGRTRSCAPVEVVRGSAADALELARTRALSLTVRGAGHSCGGQALGDGIVLETFAPGRIYASVEGALVTVSAGTSWRDLELWLNKRGLMVPVATDYLALTVGGTLSVGGFGFESIVRGGQVDHVAWARVRFASGEMAILRRGDELLRFVLAGLGRLAIVEEVGLEVVPFAPVMRSHTRHHANLIEMAKAMTWVEDTGWTRPSTHFATQYWPDGPTIERVGDEHASPAALEAAARPAWARPEHQTGILAMRRYVDHLEISRWVERFPDHRRVWCDFGFTHAALLRFVDLVERSRASPLGSAIRAVYLAAVKAPPAGRSLAAFDLRLPGHAYTYTCGLYAMVPAADAALLRDALAQLRDVTAAAIELGGRPYLYGRYDLTEVDHRRCYRRDYERYLELKRELDPADRLTSGRTTL